ncbi:MAG: carboxypeptidase-like regulatory domain-containing protein [Bryobacteraceae bacterium]
MSICIAYINRARALRLFLLSAVMAGLVWGQGGATGAIAGTIFDRQGGAVTSAAVDLALATEGSLHRSTTTNAEGLFTVSLLPPGVYTIKITAPGFAALTTQNVAVRVTETTRLNLTLDVASIAEAVEVHAEVAQVDTSSATTGQSLDSGVIGALPLATQNFQQLLTLSTGAVADLNASAALGRGDVRMEVNGQREDNNNYLIEGISASDYNIGQLTNTPLPSPDVVQEFKVQTSLYDASQGRNAGGNINAILKSGGNQFHGSAFEFFRNDDLNANEFFYKTGELQGGGDNVRPVVKQNVFGSSIGGPIGKKAALGYFFVNYQGTRQRSGLSPGTYVSTVIPVIPADRSAASLSQAFFGNPSVQLDPVAVKLLNLKGTLFGQGSGGWLVPSLSPIDPSNPSAGALLNASNPGQFRDDQFTANYDRDFRGGADKVSGRFFFTDFQSILPYGAGGLQAGLGGSIATTDLNFPFDLPVHDRFLTLTETHLFSPRLVNEYRFGYVRIVNDANNSGLVTASDLGIDRPNSNVDDLIYKFTFPSYQIGPTPQGNQSQDQNNLTFLDTASFTFGKHLLRFGGEYDHVSLDKSFPQLFNGQVFFGPSAPTGSGACAAGCSDFQNFLLGSPFFSWAGSGVFTHQYRINDFAFFAQDDYRVTSTLTLNLGLRWEGMGAPTDNLNHIGNTVSALVGQGKVPFIYPVGVNQDNIPGLTGTTSGTTMLNNYASNWAPRIGLAWSPSGAHNTSIRTGYGIYYDREDVGRVDQLSFTAPFLPMTFPSGSPGSLATLFATGAGRLPAGGVIDPAFVPVFSHVLGFTDANGNPTSDTTQAAAFDGNMINLFGLEVPRHYQVPNAQQWNFTVQQALRAGWVIEIGYVGNKGVHLRETRDSIQPYLATPQNPVRVTAADGTQYVITQSTIANANARSRVLGLAPAGYQIFANDAWSNYNSLQTTVSHRFAKNLHFQAAYTFSRALDATSSGNTAFNTAINDQTNLRGSYGLSDFDHTHRLVANFSYAPPSPHGRLGHAILGGWNLSGIVTLQSGAPFTVIDSAGGSVYQLSSPDTTTPDVASGYDVSKMYTTGGITSRLNQYLNPAAFLPAPVVGADGSTGFGTLGRNIFRGPFQQNWDVSAARSFKITERQQLKFTADFFDVWNHPVFDSPSVVDIESPSFGAITTTAGTPRLIQLSGRYSF